MGIFKVNFPFIDLVTRAEFWVKILIKIWDNICQILMHVSLVKFIFIQQSFNFRQSDCSIIQVGILFQKEQSVCCERNLIVVEKEIIETLDHSRKFQGKFPEICIQVDIKENIRKEIDTENQKNE